jgi:hypothetical protein
MIPPPLRAASIGPMDAPLRAGELCLDYGDGIVPSLGANQSEYSDESCNPPRLSPLRSHLRLR